MKYKLTDADGYTRRGETNQTLWGENVTHTATGDGTELCTDGVIHYYDSPEMAALMNPIHANLKNPVCWKGKGKKIAHDGGKGGCKTFTTLKRVELPELTTEQRVEIAIRCALAVYTEPSFVAWTNKWLSGEDRTAARAAADAAYAADAAAHAAADAAAYAAYAADAAAHAAYAADAAADAAAYAAYAADAAARAAHAAAVKINIASIIKDVLTRAVKS